MADDPISPRDFGASFMSFMNQMQRDAPPDREPFFRARLSQHFGTDPSKLTIVSDRFIEADHPNLQLALDGFTGSDGRTSELLGITKDSMSFMGVTLTHLIAPVRHAAMGDGPMQGPVEYRSLKLDAGRVLACVHTGLYLVTGASNVAILVAGSSRQYENGVRVEVLGADLAAANACLASIRTAMRKRNVYRGHVVSLAIGNDRELAVHFHRLPPITRDQIILPAGVLERIERQTVGFSQHAARLHAAGRHLKRGLLLHGSPGTGKTLTAMYLASRMPERTVLLMTGRGMGLLEQACAMARTLQPATIVLEDVDLIAEQRTNNNVGCAPLLFELLNQMDGLADDADILFVLTTNRPDLLEPALAARPGRIDLAIEVPLPDADCRRRLFDLYGRGLEITADVEPLVARTAGASAAFIRELLRKAAVFAADDGDRLAVGAPHFDAALHEMIVEGGPLTKSLLGASATS